MTSTPRVLMIAGYFDWFGGYQETVLAESLAAVARTEVVASVRVNPIFTDEHLKAVGRSREYAAGQEHEHGLDVTRFATSEVRGMVWSREAFRYVRQNSYDVVIQAMPGRAMPIAGSFIKGGQRRLVLYGDNAAMWSHLTPWERRLKGIAFAVSKGAAYRLVNGRADQIYGFTPDTVKRLHGYSSGRGLKVLPLAYDSRRFFFDPHVRKRQRQKLGYQPSDIVIISAGKVQEKKRLDILLSAFQSLAAEDSRLKLLLVGADKSDCSNGLRRAIAADRQRSGCVSFLPFLPGDELNELFNVADVGVWPRMPAITIQQAMGTGLTVALPRNDLVGHLLRPGSGDYFVPADDDDWQSLEQSLRVLIRTSPHSDVDARRQRCTSNSWLSADAIARSLLTDAGWGHSQSRQLVDLTARRDRSQEAE